MCRHNRPTTATLRTLATEVMHLLSTKLGTTRYTTALSTVQQRITTRRTARKTAQRQLAITDAQAHAERKLARNKGKKEWRKRKNEEFARGKTRLHARKRVRGGFKVDARDSE